MSNIVGVSNEELTSTALSGGKVNGRWFSTFSSKFFGELQSLKSFDFKQWASDIKGGAIAVWDNIKKGNWGFFRDWLNDAPAIPKAAGVVAGGLITGTTLIVSGAAVGFIGSGVGAVLTKTTTFGGLAAMSVPAMMGKVTQGVSTAYNFDWASSDKKLMDDLKEAANGLYNPLGETVGKSLASLVAGKVGQSVNTPTLRIREGAIAAMCMINPTIKESLIDGLSSLRYAVQEVAKKMVITVTYINARKVAARLLDKEETWGKEGQSPFIISEQVSETWTKVKQQEIFDWVNEKQWEGVETMASTFFDTLGDLLTDEGTYEEWIPV